MNATVTRNRVTTTDRYTDDVRGDERTFTIPGVIVAPADTTEPREPGRRAVVTELDFWAPGNQDLQPKDTVTIPGYDGTFTVEGHPGTWRNPFSNVITGITAKLRRVAG